MPDNLDEILDGMDATPTETPDPVENTETVEEVETVIEGTENTEPQVEETKPAHDPSLNKDFAKQRIQQKQLKQELTEREKVLERIAKQRGISVDELISEQQDRADQEDAKRRGLDPDTAKRMREMEEQIAAMNERERSLKFQSNILELQQNYGLDRDGLVNFIDRATEQGIDVMNTSMDFKTLYIAQNHERLVNDAVEKARQQWLADAETKRNQSPSTSQTKSKGTATNMSLDDFLNKLNL